MAWEIADEKTKDHIILEEREVKNSKIKSLCGISIFLGIFVFIIALLLFDADLSYYELSVSKPAPIYDYSTDIWIIENDRKAREAESQRLVSEMREELTAKYAVICIPIELGIAGITLICAAVINKKYKAFCTNAIYVKYGTCTGKTWIGGYRGTNSRIELTIHRDDGSVVEMPVPPYVFHSVENGNQVILVSSNKGVPEKVFRSPNNL